MSTLNDLLHAIFERGAKLVDWPLSPKTAERSIAELCEALMSSEGEASGIALAAEILRRNGELEPEARLDFFNTLAHDYDPDPEKVAEAAKRYMEDHSTEALAELTDVTEPRRQELFRRLNLAPDGTQQLVTMRKDLLAYLRSNPDLKRIDADFAHLLSSWFNRGFLVLQHIDWNTSASVLEKIIQYEAVHEINSWDELRLRLEPSDRRCFAFFHPAMLDEPLIFVEVALTSEVPDSIQDILKPDREAIEADGATTAVFYSISNCQDGLRGVSFGAFLIKQVAEDLARTMPNLKNFVTLSPVPGFKDWLRADAKENPEGKAAEALELQNDAAWQVRSTANESARSLITELAARYLLTAKRPNGLPRDSVARFHLGNGASLARINWLADVSEKGMQEGLGIMVNYHYKLDEIEANHEAFANRHEIKASRDLTSLID